MLKRVHVLESACFALTYTRYNRHFLLQFLHMVIAQYPGYAPSMLIIASYGRAPMGACPGDYGIYWAPTD